jgi:integrase
LTRLVIFDNQIIKMATLKFTVRGKSNPSPIYARFTDGRQLHIIAKTDFLINPEFWDEVKGMPKQTAKNPDKLNLSIELGKIQTKIFQDYERDKGTGLEINKAWLDFAIAKFKNPQLGEKNEFLIDLVKDYQSELRIKVNEKTKKPISKGTIRGFSTLLMRLEKFEQHKKKRYLISEIDLSFHSDFTKFAMNHLSLSINSIGQTLRQVKTVVLDAGDKGFEIKEQVRSKKFKAIREDSTFVTITENEIEQLRQFTGADYLQNVRDWLIIGCWTGCRVNDLMQLSKANIQIHVSGQKFIRYTQSKTGKQVDLPIHPHVAEILERLGDFPRPISDQRFNEWMKIVCLESGLIQEVQGTRQNPITHKKEVGTFQKWELIRSHTCRRSFATNHYNKLPNKLIMAVTGHSTEKMLLNYIGETENDHLSDFLSVWNTPQQKDDKIIELNKKQG